MSVFSDIKTGLTQAIEYDKGNLPAKTVILSIEPLVEFSAAEIKISESVQDSHRCCLQSIWVSH